MLQTKHFHWTGPVDTVVWEKINKHAQKNVHASWLNANGSTCAAAFGMYDRYRFNKFDNTSSALIDASSNHD